MSLTIYEAEQKYANFRAFLESELECTLPAMNYVSFMRAYALFVLPNYEHIVSRDIAQLQNTCNLQKLLNTDTDKHVYDTLSLRLQGGSEDFIDRFWRYMELFAVLATEKIF